MTVTGDTAFRDGETMTIVYITHPFQPDRLKPDATAQFMQRHP